MDIRTISSHNLIPVIDPVFLKQSPDEFLAENGGFLSEVAVVGKSSSGFVHYRSATAPTDQETKEFFSTFSTIADSIGIKVYGFVNGLAFENINDAIKTGLISEESGDPSIIEKVMTGSLVDEGRGKSSRLGDRTYKNR